MRYVRLLEMAGFAFLGYSAAETSGSGSYFLTFMSGFAFAVTLAQFAGKLES